MLKQYKSWLALLFIVLMAAFVRIWWLDSAPKGGLIDELHFGYLAYSIIETGKDEHGVSWPLLFKGFGDNKLPLGVYTLVPFVKLFGLSNDVVRYPSVLAGLIVVIASYALVRSLGLPKRLGLIAALISAVSPWPFFLSRFGFESNLGLALFMVGLAAFFYAIRRFSLGMILVGVATWGLTWYAYISYRPDTMVLLPLIVAIIYLQNRVKWRQLAVAIAFFMVLIAPNFLSSTRGANTSRLEQVGFWTDPGIVLIVDENRSFCDRRLPFELCSLLWNKGTVALDQLMQRTVYTLSADFLVLRGEGPNQFLSIDGYGLFFLIVYPLFIIGFVILIQNIVKQKRNWQTHQVILGGLLLSIVPTILVGDPQKVRISPMYPFVLLTSILGLVWLISLWKQKVVATILQLGVLLALLWQAVPFFVYYYTIHSERTGYSYQTYMPELMEFVANNLGNADIYVKPFFSDPIMFYAYYSQYDPEQYQQRAVLGELEASGFQHTVQLDTLFVAEKSLESLACRAKETDRNTFLITNENLKDTEPFLEIRSSDGVHVYAFIYRANDINPEICPE